MVRKVANITFVWECNGETGSHKVRLIITMNGLWIIVFVVADISSDSFPIWPASHGLFHGKHYWLHAWIILQILEIYFCLVVPFNKLTFIMCNYRSYQNWIVNLFFHSWLCWKCMVHALHWPYWRLESRTIDDVCMSLHQGIKLGCIPWPGFVSPSCKVEKIEWNISYQWFWNLPKHSSIL